MFFQIKIPPENQDYVRFLRWPNGDINRPLEEFRMAVHIFGAISSPIVKLVKDLVSATGEGGFRLTKFVSNSSDVLKALPAEDCSVESDKFNLDMESLMTRALGMLWDLKEDSFKFSIELKDNPFTRRGLLSTISSLYDPIGLLSPIILPAKKLLQELCQVESLDWDERIPDEPAERWQHWIQGLHLLEQLSIPRCFKSSGFGNVSGSSHVLFSDASTVGYGVAAYLVFHDGDQVQSNLVMGKSRVSPKKLVTIPRLELTAATVFVKVAQHILKELEFTVGKVVYYTDSTTVLHYIHSNTKRFPVFLANRVRVTKDYSQPEQRRYVNSSDNPADVASRGISVHPFLQYDEWFHGPSLIASDYLPSHEYVCADCVDDKSEHVSVVTISEEHHGFTRLIEYFSSWSRLQKAVSVFQQLKLILSGKGKGCVTTDAERAIIMKLKEPALSQKIADLPADRLEPSPPFNNVGI
ncbi:uncharacterized protein [Palaemon carinicauda]|uniref:uncharacterized protein n=1 Tax=Palaemon carinicauda TaxID=392227 RepID=UPI0035B5F9F6